MLKKMILQNEVLSKNKLNALKGGTNPFNNNNNNNGNENLEGDETDKRAKRPGAFA